MKLCCRECEIQWESVYETPCFNCGRRGESGFIRNSIPADSGLRSTRLALSLVTEREALGSADADVAAEVAE